MRTFSRSVIERGSWRIGPGKGGYLMSKRLEQARAEFTNGQRLAHLLEKSDNR
ncbi:hypothetical protein BDZ89DRAFT_1066445 [Hymenopellis radicata]|nr:hypothetical protein BDZ89DRAFT_1066445 [Hymenopellis radicata]